MQGEWTRWPQALQRRGKQTVAATWQVRTPSMGLTCFVQESRLLYTYLSALYRLRTFLRDADGWPYRASVSQLHGFASCSATSR